MLIFLNLHIFQNKKKTHILFDCVDLCFIYNGDFVLLSFYMINHKAVSNFLQAQSYSTLLTFHKRIACSAFSAALLLLLEYRKMIKFIKTCIIRRAWNCWHPALFWGGSLTVVFNNDLPHDGLDAEVNFPADQHLTHWHYIPGQSLNILLLQNMFFLFLPWAF